jgi:hypothetical protein
MRVSAPELGKEILDEGEATHGGADHPQAAQRFEDLLWLGVRVLSNVGADQ